MFKSLIYFKLIVLSDGKIRVQFYSFAGRYPVSSTPVTKEIILFTLCVIAAAKLLSHFSRV